MREQLVPELRVSDRGVTFVARWEGLRLAPYNDAADNATVGYGHLLHTGPVTQLDRDKFAHFTPQHAREFLMLDLAHAEAAVRSRVVPRVQLQHRYDALVSFVFNVGTGAFEHSTLLELLNHGVRGMRAADELLRWDRAGGNVIAGLANRRRAERALYLFGSYDA